MTDEHKKYLKRVRINNLVVKVLQTGLLIFLFGFWELSVRLNWADAFFFSSPSRIAVTIVDLIDNGNFFSHVLATTYEAVAGFLLSTVVGTVIAVLLWCSVTARRVFEPYLIVLNALPKIALGPILIIWLGTGRNAIIGMAFLICIVITIMSMLAGFNSIEKEKIDLLLSMGASKVQILFKLVLPGNLSTFVSVAKINVGLSWVGTIIGEYLVSREGLGYLIVYGSQIFNLDLVMASTVVLCVLASAMYIGVAFIEKLTR